MKTRKRFKLFAADVVKQKTFGPMYSESESTIHVDTFDGYSFFSIKEGWVQGNDGQEDKEQNKPEQGSDARNEAENEE